MERSQDHPDVSYPVTRRRRENSLEMQFHWKMIGLKKNWVSLVTSEFLCQIILYKFVYRVQIKKEQIIGTKIRNICRKNFT